MWSANKQGHNNNMNNNNNNINNNNNKINNNNNKFSLKKCQLNEQFYLGTETNATWFLSVTLLAQLVS